MDWHCVLLSVGGEGVMSPTRQMLVFVNLFFIVICSGYFGAHARKHEVPSMILHGAAVFTNCLSLLAQVRVI